MQTEYLKTALEVARSGNVALAAKRLYFNPQTLRTQIYTLEQELGFKLFICPNNYTRGGVEITGEGATFLFFASQALALLEEGKLEAVEGKGK